jgi:cytoskeletal protein CcmA (bactofilin family)|tara:strand:+ start:46074 stop:46535 length:462 start_codon:yes stop_codon:yes gene_type:complete
VLGRDKKSSHTNYSDHTLIAPSAQIRGDVEFSGGLHVMGKVIGSITVTGDGGRLVIGESGFVEGEIHVPKVVVNGRVVGDVHAAEHLELAEKAVVEGNVYYTMIEMVMGAQVNGKLVRESAERKHLPSPDQVKSAADIGNADKGDTKGSAAKV